jgi:dipeptide/tripeptide permease
MLKNALAKTTKIYNEYPRTFWIVVLVTFIDRFGGALIFPFFALYLTSKFDVGMTDVGVLFGTFSAAMVVLMRFLIPRRITKSSPM